jgi:glycosyltransferase involved in cell wall biosynthesis
MTRVALVHDWLTGMRGGEYVLEALCRLYPSADIFTLVHAPDKISPEIGRHRVFTSFLQSIPGARRRYRYFLPVMPWAVESFDLRAYDLVISSSHCVAKAARVRAGALHLCYCHTPMRYIWDHYLTYFSSRHASLPVRLAMGLVREPLRRWDVATQDRVHRFVANSAHVAERIRRLYGRESEVIHPPVDVEGFPLSSRDEGHYLMITALVPYKRADVAVEAFNRMKLPLRIVGSGPEYDRLKSRAGSTVTLTGWLSRDALKEEYARCRALIFPGEEDFGIVPVEAMASGKPVIALGRGGALETVVGLDDPAGRPPTGVFFPRETPSDLIDAVRLFESRRRDFNPAAIRAWSQSFRREVFEERFRTFVSSALTARSS